mmetsp:Transcript_27318/g.24200  ORF Transcript_27318/g.24200 Transcript_27318/m.24200 type:complete len:82 (+) Transcript_27318:60-305(+)
MILFNLSIKQILIVLHHDLRMNLDRRLSTLNLKIRALNNLKICKISMKDIFDKENLEINMGNKEKKITINNMMKTMNTLKF